MNFTKQEIELRVNKIGKASIFPFKLHSLISQKIIKIESLTDKTVTQANLQTILYKLSKNHDLFPHLKKQTKLEQLRIKINNMGKSNTRHPYQVLSFFNNPKLCQPYYQLQVKLQSLKTKKTVSLSVHSVLKGTNPFDYQMGGHNVLSLKEVVQIFNQVNKTKLNNQFNFISTELAANKPGEKKSRFITIEHKTTKIKQKLYLSYFQNKKFSAKNFNSPKSLEDIKNLINTLGKKSMPPYSFVKSEIKNLTRFTTVTSGNKTKTVNHQNLRKGYNPFKKEFENEKVLIQINEMGKNNQKGHPYKCITTPDQPNFKDNLVIEDLITGERLKIKYWLLINSAYIFGTRREHESLKVEKLINKIGQKSSTPFKCQSPFVGKSASNGGRIVSIQCLKTKEVKECRLSKLKEGVNPFNPKAGEPIELNQIQPMYEKLFKKLGLEYIKNYKLGKGAFVDFVVFVRGFKVAIEVKRSDVFNSKRNQIKRYQILCKSKQHNISHFFLSDPQGNHRTKNSISILELEIALRNLK